MTIKEAVEKMIRSEKFIEDARKDAKLRMFKSRYLRGYIENLAAIRLLERYGYKVDIKHQRAIF